MGKPWIISVDLDGVLAKPTSSENYPTAQAILENVAKVNKLHDLGHRIVIYTARRWYDFDMTSDWLKRNGIKYHQLVMGKLYAHAYIDDLNYTLDGILVKLTHG